jgi:phosphate-selective porin
VANPRPPTQSELISQAKASTIHIANSNNVAIEEIEDCPVVGNQSGLEYAMARQNLSKDMEDMKVKMEAMDQLFSRSIGELQQTVAVLTADSDKYKQQKFRRIQIQRI